MLLLAISILCLPCRADSDGFFCATKGYVAFNLREGLSSGVKGHVLRIARFEPGRGIYIAGEVALQDFQVHHMTCGADKIEISGWGSVFKQYVIDIGSAANPHIADFSEDPARRFDPSKEGPEPSDFVYGPGRTIALESSDPGHNYKLVLSRSEKRVEGGIEHRSTAEVFQLEASGSVTQRVVLYRGHYLETID
jgi:hypothetical protein